MLALYGKLCYSATCWNLALPMHGSFIGVTTAYELLIVMLLTAPISQLSRSILPGDAESISSLCSCLAVWLFEKAASQEECVLQLKVYCKTCIVGLYQVDGGRGWYMGVMFGGQ